MQAWKRSRGQKREMNTQQPSRPAITPAMREQAKKQPNSWLYVVDPIFTDPNAEVPPWGFIGGYRVDERGEITDEFSPNPNYRPSRSEERRVGKGCGHPWWPEQSRRT